jgi:hypothetical protein
MRQDIHFRYHILNEIRRLATQTGKPPSAAIFAKDTLIFEEQWKDKFWPQWGDALTEAGFGRVTRTKQLRADEVLVKIVGACRTFGKVPTYAELDEYRRINPDLPGNKVIAKYFSDRAGLILALTNLAATNDEFSDLKALLPRQLPFGRETASRANRTTDGFVYLIKSAAYYKIAQTETGETPLNETSAALAVKTVIVHTIRTDDPEGIEAYWHNRFKQKRTTGGWFNLSPADVSAFQKRKYQ